MFQVDQINKVSGFNVSGFMLSKVKEVKNLKRFSSLILEFPTCEDRI